MTNVPVEQRNWVDLRSDTVTRPTPEMFAAMQAAMLGDDVLGDDPTVANLEETAARLTGKEAALFVPSGTMGNQIAVASHTQPGDAVLLEEDAHILYYEVGAPAVLSGVVTWTLPSVRGAMDPQAVEKRILKASLHTPGTKLLCLENSHNRAGGAIIPLEHMRAYREIADRKGVKVHLDGARVFNAAVGLNVDVREITNQIDSVSVCLSKGLGSPVGSVLCGTREFIKTAHVWRKRLGGGMRQAGLLAACGLVSLTKMVDRLAEDHARAKRVAAALANLSGINVDVEGVQTNLLLVSTEIPAERWCEELARRNIMCFPVAEFRLRLVFHYDVNDEGCDRAIEAFHDVARHIA